MRQNCDPDQVGERAVELVNVDGGQTLALSRRTLPATTRQPYRLPPLGTSVPLNRIAQTPIWQCLVDVYRSRGAEVALVDHLCSVVPTDSKAAAAPDSQLQEDTKRHVQLALESGRASILSGNGRLMSLTPLIHGSTSAGAVLVFGDRPDLDEMQLARAGALLARAIEDSLIDSHEELAMLSRRVATLHQLLHASATTGSAHDIVQQFAEALTVWEEAEIFGYRSDLDDRFWLEVALPGSDRSTAPAVIDGTRLPRETSPVLISRADKEDLGFRIPGDVLVARVVSDAGAWVLAIHGEAHAPDRLELYLAALRIALPVALARESARLTWAMMQHFVEATSLEEGAAGALEVVSAAVAGTVSLSIWNTDGRLALAIGAPADPDIATIRTALVLRNRVDAPASLTAILDAQRSDVHGFGAREKALFDAAVDSLRTWLTTAAPQLAGRGERRHGPHGFDQVVERYLRYANGHGTAAMILISSSDVDAPERSYEWIRHVRPHLRPTDLVGRLASGDVAVVALDTPTHGALVVARRIAHILDEEDQSGQPVVRVGAASAVRTSVDGLVIDRSQLDVVQWGSRSATTEAESTQQSNSA